MKLNDPLRSADFLSSPHATLCQRESIKSNKWKEDHRYHWRTIAVSGSGKFSSYVQDWLFDNWVDVTASWVRSKQWKNGSSVLAFRQIPFGLSSYKWHFKYLPQQWKASYWDRQFSWTVFVVDKWSVTHYIYDIFYLWHFSALVKDLSVQFNRFHAWSCILYPSLMLYHT